MTMHKSKKSKKSLKSGTEKLKALFGEFSFGDYLMSFRKGENLTQTELAKKLKISRQNLCDLEKSRVIPSLERAEKIAKLLGESELFYIEAAMRDFLKRKHKNLSLKIIQRKAS